MRRRDALKGLLGWLGMAPVACAARLRIDSGPAPSRVVVRGRVRFARSTVRLVPAWTAEEQRAWGCPA